MDLSRTPSKDPLSNCNTNLYIKGKSMWKMIISEMKEFISEKVMLCCHIRSESPGHEKMVREANYYWKIQV